jgi:hypothetical protein
MIPTTQLLNADLAPAERSKHGLLHADLGYLD